MFKVVPDQLKVSQGWVRCGHCTEIFDASLHLQAAPVLEKAPPAPPPVPPQAAPVAPAPPVKAASDPFFSSSLPPFPPIFVPSEGGGKFSHSVAPFADSVRPPSLPEFSSTAGRDSDFGDFDPADWKKKLHSASTDESSELNLSLDEFTQGNAGAMGVEAHTAKTTTSGPPELDFGVRTDFDTLETLPESGPDESEDVSFVRDARRKAFWRKPLVRLVLFTFSLLLAALLLLQLVVQQRDLLAAHEPGLKPLLQTMCEQLRCELGPLRQIDALVIDSSSFNKLSDDSYRLSFSIKNTASRPVAMPSLEVTLTDTQDQALVRRVLAPAQFAAGSMLSAGADFAGLVVLQVTGTTDVSATSVPAGPLRVAGYRVLAFYP